jgi:hypothetical protein
LLVAGVVGLVAAGKRAATDDLAQVSIVWLVPLVGLFGFIAGLTYPYYRFFNTTLAWILLVGLGAYFAIRFFLDIARRGGLARLAAIGVVAVLAIVVANFADGLGASGWNDPAAGWLSTSEKRDLDAVRAYLTNLGQDRPVVFVVDNKPPTPFQIYGFAKLAGNTSRYGLPAGQVDNGYLYLGSVTELLRNRPTFTGQPTYDRLSQGFLTDTQQGIAASGRKPVVVLDQVFNTSGANAAMETPDQRAATLAADVVTVADGQVTVAGERSSTSASPAPKASLWHLPLLLLALLALFLPGWLAIEWFLPKASWAEMLGMVPALSVSILVLIGIVVLAVVRDPFSGSIAWLCGILGIAIAAFLRARSWSSLPRGRVTHGSSLS